jgi:hypothetical protein
VLGLDRRTASYTWTVVFILVLLRVVYLIRETLFVFVVALLFAYLLWPLVRFLDRWLPGRSKALALGIVYLSLPGAASSGVPRLWGVLLSPSRSLCDSAGGYRLSSRVYSLGGAPGGSGNHLVGGGLERLSPPALDPCLPGRLPGFPGLCPVAAPAQCRHGTPSMPANKDSVPWRMYS